MDILEAAKSGELSLVKRLLAEGADPNELDALKRTPLHVASLKGADDVVAVLIDSGAEVNARDYRGTTPLHYACYGGFPKTVRALLQHGAHAAALDTHEDTPLHKCAGGATTRIKDRIATAQMLIDAGCPVDASNYSGQTALWHSAWRGAVGLVELLLSHGADPSIRARGQQGSPLDAARMNRMDEVVRLLEGRMAPEGRT